MTPCQPAQKDISSTTVSSCNKPQLEFIQGYGQYLFIMEKEQFILQMEQVSELGNKSVTISMQDFKLLIKLAKESHTILKEMVELKEMNDNGQRSTIEFVTRQPKAWEAAKNFVKGDI